MEEQKVIIVGCNDVLAAKTALINIEHKAVIFAQEEETQLPFPKSDPFIIRRNPYVILNVYKDKQFVCKGKHQYREVNTKQKEGEGGILMKSEWICQCGRKTTD